MPKIRAKYEAESAKNKKQTRPIKGKSKSNATPRSEQIIRLINDGIKKATTKKNKLNTEMGKEMLNSTQIQPISKETDKRNHLSTSKKKSADEANAQSQLNGKRDNDENKHRREQTKLIPSKKPVSEKTKTMNVKVYDWVLREIYPHLNRDDLKFDNTIDPLNRYEIIRKMTYLEKRGCQFAYFKRCSGNVANEGFVRMPAGTEKYSTVTTFTVRYVLLRGIAEFWINDKRFDVQAGKSIQIPLGARYGIRSAQQTSIMRFICYRTK